jgi:hypothetical protein
MMPAALASSAAISPTSLPPWTDVLLVDSLIPDYGGNLFNIDGIADRVRERRGHPAAIDDELPGEGSGRHFNLPGRSATSTA